MRIAYAVMMMIVPPEVFAASDAGEMKSVLTLSLPVAAFWFEKKQHPCLHTSAAWDWYPTVFLREKPRATKSFLFSYKATQIQIQRR